MVFWIFAALALFFVQTVLAPVTQYLVWNKGQLRTALGPRDNPPPMPIIGERMERALKNMMEALPVFLTLALLTEIKGISGGVSELGAMVFVLARVFYVPAYLSGVPGVRSFVWTVGAGGLVLMIVGLLPYLG